MAKLWQHKSFKITSKAYMLDTDIHDDIIKMINNHTPFSFVRYGDGEWGSIFKDTNLHKTLISKWGESITECGERMLNIIKSETPKQSNYYLGIQPLGYSIFTERIAELVNGLNTCNADILHSRNSKGNIDDFLNSLQGKDIILIGPWYLKNLTLFNFKHIETEQYGSWLHLDIVKDNIINELNSNKKKILLFSCSLAAKILIDELYRIYGKDIIQIDTGSLFDPYCGMNSRNYHINVIKRLGLNESDMMKPKIK